MTIPFVLLTAIEDFFEWCWPRTLLIECSSCFVVALVAFLVAFSLDAIFLSHEVDLS